MRTRCHSGNSRGCKCAQSTPGQLPPHTPVSSPQWGLGSAVWSPEHPASCTAYACARPPLPDSENFNSHLPQCVPRSGQRFPLSLELVSETKAFSLGHSQAPIPALNAGCGAECERVVGTQPRRKPRARLYLHSTLPKHWRSPDKGASLGL